MSARGSRNFSSALLAGIAAVSMVVLTQPTRSEAGACVPVVVGIDTSHANGSGTPFLGEAIGQTFLARDTLISSLTLWRVASEDTNLFGLRLFITRADSTGYPLLSQVVLNGAVVYNPYGDGIHPIPFNWAFDPPVQLPGAGNYAFFIELTPCIGGYSDVLGRESTEDLYPEGHYWRTSRSGSCIPSGVPHPNVLADFIFRLEFCDTSTPVRPSSWGRLKAIYR